SYGADGHSRKRGTEALRMQGGPSQDSQGHARNRGFTAETLQMSGFRIALARLSCRAGFFLVGDVWRPSSGYTVCKQRWGRSEAGPWRGGWRCLLPECAGCPNDSAAMRRTRALAAGAGLLWPEIEEAGDDQFVDKVD